MSGFLDYTKLRTVHIDEINDFMLSYYQLDAQLKQATAERDEARRIARRMMAERDSETRWANHYFQLWQALFADMNALREQYNGLVPFMNDIERERADWMGKYYELLRKYEPDRSQPFEYTTEED